MRRTLCTIALLAAAAFGLAFAPVASQSAKPVLLRTNPRIHEVRLEVELFQQEPTGVATGTVYVDPVGGRSTTYVKTQPTYTGTQISMAVPVLVRTSWCDTDFTQVVMKGTVDGREYVMDAAKAFVRESGSAEATLRFEMPFARGAAESILTRATYQVQRWELQVDEAAAATATWPREWASGMDRFLKKEPGIDPTNARLKAFADAATNGGARSVSPYYAVKNAALAIVRGWRLPNSGTSVYGQRGGLRGLNFTVDAPWGFEAGGGTPVELAATCVAAVRALGVPSRVVYCLVERSRSNDSRSGTSGREFRMICEFFLPNIGWIPFDPMMMRQHTTGGNVAIRGFANIPNIQDALPLAYLTVPNGYQMADRYALWGWKRGVVADEPTAVTRIGFDDSSRGNGKVPSMPAPVSDEAP